MNPQKSKENPGKKHQNHPHCVTERFQLFARTGKWPIYMDGVQNNNMGQNYGVFNTTSEQNNITGKIKKKSYKFIFPKEIKFLHNLLVNRKIRLNIISSV